MKGDPMISVAVIDDEPITRMDIAGMLKDLGYSVAGEAGDGFDAVALCRAKHPDVVLMDVKMPVFDGLSASKVILDEDLAGSVVLLTAFSDEEIVEKASRIGVSGYLVKPVEQQRLRPVIEVAVAQSRRLRESKKETEDANRRLEESKLIARAQSLYAKKEGLSESESYQVLRKTAMDKRLPLAVIAKAYLEQEEQA
ncbi:MAG: response regulator [Firmicutes bacterium]|nr:response regulator [Bacillota bacterium]